MLRTATGTLGTEIKGTPISVTGPAPVAGKTVKTTSAIDALAVCDGRRYAGVTESGTVLQFDPATGAIGASASFVPDLACTR